MDKVTEIAVLKEKNEAHHTRLAVVEGLVRNNAEAVANLITTTAVLSSHVDILIKIIFGGTALALGGMLIAMLKLVVNGFASPGG